MLKAVARKDVSRPETAIGHGCLWNPRLASLGQGIDLTTLAGIEPA